MISDTHGLLRPEAVAALEGCETILHAGDVGDREILDRLASIAPVFAIRGNVDHGDWADGLPAELTIELCSHAIHMVHDIGDLRHDPAAFAMIVCGHSHRPRIDRLGEAVLLNPGSAGPRRFRLPVTLATLDLREGESPEPVIRALLP